MTMSDSASSDVRERVLSKWQEIEWADPWGVLGLQPNAGSEEIKRAYFELAKEFHTDAWSEAALGDVKPVLDRVFARVAEAYDVLSDPHKRAELDAERAIKSSGMSTDIAALFDAEQDFSKGRALLARGEITAASKFFTRAIAQNSGNREWHAHHLFASWWPGRARADALPRIVELEAIAKADERLLDAAYFAGRLALEVGDLQKAGKHLKRVARDDPGHQMALRDLRLLNRKLEETAKKSGGLFSRLFGKKL